MLLERSRGMAVSAALLWLFWLGCGNARVLMSLDMAKGPNTLFSRGDGQKFVWRGDSRNNETIRRDGGFRPRGNYVNDEEAYDLERHKQGAMAWKEDQYGSKESSAESCTASEMGWASAYVATASSSRAVSRFPWIYLVRGTPNMIDSVRALNFNDDEDEFAALGGLLWSQVVGHMTRETVQRLERDYPDGIPDDVAVENVVPNPQHDAERFRDSYAHSSLAEAYGRGSRQAAMEFMARAGVGEVVGWTGQFPLLPTDSPCPSSSSSRQSSSEKTQPGQQGQTSALTEQDMLAAADYLREHNEPCEPDSDPLHSYLVTEAEDAIATSLERLRREDPDGPFGHNHGNGVCNLLGGCDSMFGELHRHKRAKGDKWLQHGPGFQPQNVWLGKISPEDWREVSS